MRRFVSLLIALGLLWGCSPAVIPPTGALYNIPQQQPVGYPGSPQIADPTFTATVNTEDIFGRVLVDANVTIQPTITSTPGVTANNLVPPTTHEDTTDATGVTAFDIIPSVAFLQPRPYQYQLTIVHPSEVQAAVYTFSMPAMDVNVHEILDLEPPNQPARPYDQGGLYDTMTNLLLAGTNITLSEDDTANTITISAAGGGTGGGVSIQDEGLTIVADATILNVTGSGVNVTNQGSGIARIAITGGGGGTTVVANPGGSPADTLSTITIGSSDYSVPAGSGSATPLATTAPPEVMIVSAVGTSGNASRQDHSHGYSTALGILTPTPITPTGGLGTSVLLAREDHAHAYTTQAADWALRNNAIDIIPASKLGSGTTNNRFLVGGPANATWQTLNGAPSGYTNAEDALVAFVSGEVAVVSGGTDGQLLSRSGNSFQWVDPSGGSTPFDLHDDVTTPVSALANADHLLASDESTAGDPMRFIQYDAFRGNVRPDWQSAGTVVDADTDFINVTGGGATLTTSGAGLELNIPSGAGGAFDLHDDVANSLSVLADADRLLTSDESITGDPNRYIRFENLREDIRPNWQVDGIFLVDDPDFINVLGGATFTVSGGGLNMTIPSGGGTGTTVVANPGGSPATNLSLL